MVVLKWFGEHKTFAAVALKSLQAKGFTLFWLEGASKKERYINVFYGQRKMQKGGGVQEC